MLPLTFLEMLAAPFTSAFCKFLNTIVDAEIPFFRDWINSFTFTPFYILFIVYRLKLYRFLVPMPINRSEITSVDYEQSPDIETHIARLSTPRSIEIKLSYIWSMSEVKVVASLCGIYFDLTSTKLKLHGFTAWYIITSLQDFVNLWLWSNYLKLLFFSAKPSICAVFSRYPIIATK